MRKFEEIVGNILAVLFVLVIVFGVLFSIFTLLFRDGRGLGWYGGRGNMYMYDGY